MPWFMPKNSWKENMSDYRNSAGQVARDTRWTFFRFLWIGIAVVMVLFALGFGLRSAGIIGKTAVERKVFEQSYQRDASFKARIAIDEAALAQIESQLMHPSLDENTRFNLEAQASAARSRIDAAGRQQ
jgi:hypothetical protein